jgi:ATPase family AAA domain-containing protein 3A/B
MFGGGNKKRKEEQSLSSALAPENAPAKGGGNSVTGFDPEGLERAAKAARDLDGSKNAKAAIELIKTQEATKQVSELETRRFQNLSKQDPIHV